jgi:hypothetical protein
MKKIRVRIGVRLSWPITNAATFVVYLSERDYDDARDAVGVLNLILPPDISKRFIFERADQ